MDGRGASSASAKGVTISSPNAEKHRKFLAGELGSRYSKSNGITPAYAGNTKSLMLVYQIPKTYVLV